MPVVNPEKLIGLQRNADEVRNVRTRSFTSLSQADTEVDLYTSARRK